MSRRRQRVPRAVGSAPFVAVCALGLLWAAVSGGCVAIADVDDIVFAPAGVGGDGGSGDGGSGGSGAQGAGTTHTCDDGEQNGQEEGVDCGGPDCPTGCDESCTNGQDDNDDGLTDCEDPICGGYQCAPAVPTGWTGPVALHVTTEKTETPLECDPAFSESATAFSGFSASVASCSACSCSISSATDCSVDVGLYLWSVADCDGFDPPDGMANFSQGPDSCVGLSGQTYASAASDGMMAHDVQCDQSGGAPNGALAEFAELALLCSNTTVGGGCAETGAVCVRQPPAPFLDSACILQPGDIECPADGYTERRLVYEGHDDSRGCTGCACAAPSHVVCNGTMWVYSNGQCSDDETVVPQNMYSCLNQSGIRGAKYTLDGTYSGGQCQPSGGTPTGTATPTGPTTVCCMP